MDGLDPAEYLATKRLGSLKWLCEPASSSAPLPTPVSPSPALPVHQCVCCEAQADVLQHVARFLTLEELSSLSCVSRRLADFFQDSSTRDGEVERDDHRRRRCWSGPLVPPLGLTTCANDETRTGKACHHKRRARYVHQPLRTESNNDHALYWLDLERPQRILAARGAREESSNGSALATENGNGHSSTASTMTGSNAQRSGTGNGRITSSSKQRLGGGKEEGEAAEEGGDQQSQARNMLKLRAATLAASLTGGGVMVVFVVWQQSVTKSPPSDDGTPLLLAVYLLLSLACLWVGLWMWQMYFDRQRQSAMMPTASLTRRTRGKRRNQQQMGNGAGGHAPDPPTTRDEEESQGLLERGGTDYGSGQDGP